MRFRERYGGASIAIRTYATRIIEVLITDEYIIVVNAAIFQPVTCIRKIGWRYKRIMKI